MKLTNFKTLATVLGMTAALGTAMPSRQAHAVAAIFTGGATLPAAGVLLGLGTAAGLLSFLPVAMTLVYEPANPVAITAVVGISLMLVAGIVLLDDTTNVARLIELSPQAASDLQITPAERLAYNSEIEEMNVLAESAYLDLQAKMPPQQIAERYEGTLSPLAHAAVAKVLKGTVGKVKTATR